MTFPKPALIFIPELSIILLHSGIKIQSKLKSLISCCMRHNGNNQWHGKMFVLCTWWHWSFHQVQDSNLAFWVIICARGSTVLPQKSGHWRHIPAEPSQGKGSPHLPGKVVGSKTSVGAASHSLWVKLESLGTCVSCGWGLDFLILNSDVPDSDSTTPDGFRKCLQYLGFRLRLVWSIDWAYCEGYRHRQACWPEAYF